MKKALLTLSAFAIFTATAFAQSASIQIKQVVSPVSTSAKTGTVEIRYNATGLGWLDSAGLTKYFAAAADIPTTLAALTDDSTHRLVTDTEKSTWNGKQDALGFTAVPDTRTIGGNPLSADISNAQLKASVIAAGMYTSDVEATGDYLYLSAAQKTVATQAATSSLNGYLSSTDWSTFNGKAPTASPVFTGSITTPLIKPASDSTAAIQVTKADGTTPVLTVDSTSPLISYQASANVKIRFKQAVAGMNGVPVGITGLGGGINFSRPSDGLELYSFFVGNDADFYFTTRSNYHFITNGTEKFTILEAGKVGFRVTVPTAYVHISAGTATAGTAPLKLTVGTALTTAEGGVINHVGTTTDSSFTVTPYIGSTATVKTIAYKENTPAISTGTAAPATTPGKAGDIYVDTSAKKLYFSVGTGSSSDWTIAN